MKTLAIAAGAALVLMVGALLAITVATRDGAPPAATSALPAPAPAPRPAPAAPTTAPPAGSPGVLALPRAKVDLAAASGAAPQYENLAAAPPKGSWEAVEPVAEFSALGPVGAGVARELTDFESRVAACFDEDTQARHGTTPYTQAKDGGRTPDTGTTILMLQLEGQSGGIRIVDAPVETRGGASDGLVACIQQVLRGQVLSVPAAVPGKKYRVLYTPAR